MDLSVFDFITWLISSNSEKIPFVFKDMFYRRIKLAMLLFTFHGCLYRTLGSGRCNKVYSEQTVGYGLKAPY